MSLFATTEMGVLPALGAVFAGLIGWAFLVHASRSFRLRKFSGPLSLPLVGNLYDPSAMTIITYIRKMTKVHGKIFTFWPGMSPMLVCSEPTAARQILTDTKAFIKGTDYTEKFSVVFGDGLVTSNGDMHKHDRGCLARFFAPANINKHLPMFVSETQRMMNEFLEPKLGQEMDVEHFFHMLALRMFGRFSCSHDYGDPKNHEVAEGINNAVKFGSNVIGEHIVLNIPVTKLLPRVRKLHRIVKYVDDHLDTLIDARLEKMHRGEEVPEDSLSALLNDSQPRERLHSQLRTLLSAGHDTTAFFGCYMAHLLAQHPKTQDKVKEEVATVLGSRTDITSEDISQLKFCRQVLQETLRLYTVIPFVNRTASKDVTLKPVPAADGSEKKQKSMTIPKGTVVLVPLCNMNRDVDVWEEPNSFRPERFADITGHSSAKHGYLPFGYGSRTCIGNNLALTEGTIMVALLMQKYRFYPVAGFKPSVIAGISMVSKNGIRIRVESEPAFKNAHADASAP